VTQYTVGEPLTLPLSYASATPNAEVRAGVITSCTNAAGSGSANGAGYQGIVDFSILETAMTGYIASHHITPDQFPIFILYDVMYSQNGLFYLGEAIISPRRLIRRRSRLPDRRLRWRISAPTDRDRWTSLSCRTKSPNG
jgi:hypothetical protein